MASRADIQYKAAMRSCGKMAMAGRAVARLADRVEGLQDPATRFSVLTTLMELVFSFGLEFLQNWEEYQDEELEAEGGLSPEKAEVLRRRRADTAASTAAAAQRMTALFDNLSAWVASPTYGPDHPYGNALMREQQETFEARAPKPAKPRGARREERATGKAPAVDDLRARRGSSKIPRRARPEEPATGKAADADSSDEEGRPRKAAHGAGASPSEGSV